MLVTFSCKAHESITMFYEVAQRLLIMMGHSGTVPSAILAEEVPHALARLQEGLKKQKQPKQAALLDDEEEDDVPLTHRALPLIQLLQNAIQANCNVMWKAV